MFTNNFREQLVLAVTMVYVFCRIKEYYICQMMRFWLALNGINSFIESGIFEMGISFGML